MASTPQEMTTKAPYANGHHNGLVDQEPLSEAGKYVSEEEYWAKYYEHPDFSYEWNNGILEEKPMPDLLNVNAYRWFLILLDLYLRVNPVAYLTHLETGVRFQVSLNNTKIRKPDAFIVRHDNPNPLGVLDRSYRGTCDLAIESLSDSTENEVKRDTETKFTEYRLAGIKEYFILDVKDRTRTAFYRLSLQGQYREIVPKDNDIIESTVLPGFRFRISDLFKGPALADLANDEVYQGYVLLEYQEAQKLLLQEKRRAEEEKQRAEEEKRRAEEEKQQKEQLAALLDELGYDPNTLKPKE